MVFTYQTRLTLTPDLDVALTAYAALYGHVERSLFAAVQSAGPGQLSKLKPVFMRKHGITARQYNALSVGLRGKISSISRAKPLQIKDPRR